MATSSFTQNFKITKKQSDAFIDMLKNPVTPTLNKDFQSKILNSSDLRTKENIEKALQ